MTNQERLKKIGLGASLFGDDIELVQYTQNIGSEEGLCKCSASRVLSDQEIKCYAFYLILALNKKGISQITIPTAGKKVTFSVEEVKEEN